MRMFGFRCGNKMLLSKYYEKVDNNKRDQILVLPSPPTKNKILKKYKRKQVNQEE